MADYSGYYHDPDAAAREFYRNHLCEEEAKKNGFEHEWFFDRPRIKKKDGIAHCTWCGSAVYDTDKHRVWCTSDRG